MLLYLTKSYRHSLMEEQKLLRGMAGPDVLPVLVPTLKYFEWLFHAKLASLMMVA
jgi:hypothetical protein